MVAQTVFISARTLCLLFSLPANTIALACALEAVEAMVSFLCSSAIVSDPAEILSISLNDSGAKNNMVTGKTLANGRLQITMVRGIHV